MGGGDAAKAAEHAIAMERARRKREARGDRGGNPVHHGARKVVEMERIRREHATEMERARQEHAAELEKARQEHRQALEQQGQAHQLVLEQLASENQKELQKLRQDMQKVKEQEVGKLQQQMKKLQQQGEKDIVLLLEQVGSQQAAQLAAEAACTKAKRALKAELDDARQAQVAQIASSANTNTSISMLLGEDANRTDAMGVAEENRGIGLELSNAAEAEGQHVAGVLWL